MKDNDAFPRMNAYITFSFEIVTLYLILAADGNPHLI